MRRRTLLAGGLGAAALGVAAPLLTRRIEDEVQGILRDGFGDTIARAPEADVFVADFTRLWTDTNGPLERFGKRVTWMLGSLLPAARADERTNLAETVTFAFLRSTNAVRALETGEPLVYLGMPDPYASPCANPLGALWL